AASPLRAAASRPPRTPVEELVAGVWSDLLAAPVGVEDDFFALGGHSLLATRVVSRIYETLDGPVSVASIFETPTIAGLAPLLAERTPAPAAAPAGHASPHRLLSVLDQLSDEALDQLLSDHPEPRAFE
ncbi:MAG TPA: phosphopantetheine-binding protein, partial [Longimicrobium sp.]|nr:phosphopantetheine-binding protein [Longimicrobium sp.]